MKNIFKFMGLALVFGALTLTACSKDENDSSASSVTVKFNSAEWSTSQIYWEQMTYQSGGVAPYYGWQIEKGSDINDPLTYGITPDAVGTTHGDFTSQSIEGSLIWTYIVDDNDYTVYNGEDIPMHYGYTATNVITAIDATACTVSMTVEGTTFDTEKYVASQGATFEVNGNLNINVNNVKWTVME